jgi:hypothetical protein
MIGNYWKSIEKIIKHNYGIEYEGKKQEIREKKLRNFVNKHLKLSASVAEELERKV